MAPSLSLQNVPRACLPVPPAAPPLREPAPPAARGRGRGEGGAGSAPPPQAWTLAACGGVGGGECSSLERNILHLLPKVVLIIFNNVFKASVLSVFTARLWSLAIRCRAEAQR